MPMDRESLSAIGLAASRTVTGRSSQQAGQGLFAQRTSDCAAAAMRRNLTKMLVRKVREG